MLSKNLVFWNVRVQKGDIGMFLSLQDFAGSTAINKKELFFYNESALRRASGYFGQYFPGLLRLVFIMRNLLA